MLALGMIALMVSTAYFAQGDVASDDSQAVPEPDSVDMVGPGFKAYSLRELSRTDGTNQTAIRFSADDLPFDFDCLVFGDYSRNPVAGATYYAGSGMILNVSGPNGSVILRGLNGTIIRTVEYQGQESIVFNGETVYTSTPKASTRFEGTDILVQEWLRGTWSPGMGVVLERPAGMTVENSEFYLMVFQPPAAVPEFGAFPVAALTVAIVCALISRTRGKRPD